MSLNVQVNKSQVALRFAQAHRSYNDHAVVQKLICQQLLKLICLYQDEIKLQNVLEIGCGSGQLSQFLLQNFDINQMILNDLYPEIEEYFENHNNVQFLIGDIETLSLNMPLDLVVSSSALQWVDDIDVVLSKIFKGLKPDGLFCFSSFGLKNLLEIKQLTGQGLNYLQPSELKEYLEKNGFEILHLSESLELMHFDHPRLVLKHLKATGVTATASHFRWTKTKLNEFYQNYEIFKLNKTQNKQQYPLTYHPIYCIARRMV